MTRITTKSIYFTHDSNARNDVKVLALRKKHKLVGYALYFLLLEQLSASNDYKISMNNIDDLAFDFRIDDTSIIQDIIENYDLFTIEDGYFYSKAHREKMQYKDEKADKKRELILARMAGLTPEELSKQNQKAARAKWDKYNAEKSKNNDSAQSSCIGCTDVSASDALNKNKNKDKYKDKDENMDKETLDFGDCVPSAPSSPSVTPQTTHTPNVANNEIDELNDNTPNENLSSLPSFSDFKLNPPKEVQNQIDDRTTHPNTQIGVRRNHLIDAYLQFIFENGVRKIDLKRFEKLLYYTFWLAYNMNYTEANKQLMYPIDQETYSEICKTFEKLITNKNTLNNYNEYIKANDLK